MPRQQTEPGSDVFPLQPDGQSSATSDSCHSLLDEFLAAPLAAVAADDEPVRVRAQLKEFLAANTPEQTLQLWLRAAAGRPLRMDDSRRGLARDIARIDVLLSDQVNQILHSPAFQALESAWRGLHYLWRTRRDLLSDRGLEDKASPIEIRVLNVSRKELKKDFEDAVDFDQNQLFRKVYEEEFGTAGGHPFGALIANYEFTNHPDDIDLLARLSGIGAAAFAPVIAAAAPSLLGLDDFSLLEQPMDLEKIFQQPKYRKWRSLREKPDAQFLGLTLPRVLLRAPYRDDGLHRHGFRFREDVEEKDRSHYLWGSAAWPMGAVILRAFATSGWFADIRGVERGVEGGGLVTGLESCCFQTDPAGVAIRSSVEVSVSDVRESELCDMGFIPLSHCRDTEWSVFYSNQSVHRPEKYSEAAATANARISAMLQYVLCCSRIAHVLKVKARNKIGSMSSAREIENELKTWLVDYVTPDEKAAPSWKARYPLREADVQVEEIAGEPGKFNLTMRLLPHYQLDQLSSCVTLVARRMEFRE